MDRHIPRASRTWKKMHLIFRCPLYYDIRGHYHCLYRDLGGSLSTFFCYSDQRCLTLFIREIFSYRSQFLHVMPRLGMTKTIICYLLVFQIEPTSDGQILGVYHRDQFGGVKLSTSPYSLKESSGSTPDRSRAGCLSSVKLPPRFKGAANDLSKASSFDLGC
jgi:hypothetical protein